MRIQWDKNEKAMWEELREEIADLEKQKEAWKKYANALKNYADLIYQGVTLSVAVQTILEPEQELRGLGEIE